MAWLAHQTMSFLAWTDEQPKGKPGTSWRLLRRLIGENLFHAVCQQWGSCGSSILNRSPPCNPNWDCFFDVISRVRESFRAGGRALHYFICFRPEIFGLFLSARMNLWLPVQVLSEVCTVCRCKHFIQFFKYNNLFCLLCVVQVVSPY